MAGTDDDHSTDDCQRFCLLRDAHSYFLELTGLEEHAKKLVVNFLRGGEYDPTGRRRYRLYEIKAFPGGTAPSPYDGEFWCSYPEHDILCEVDCRRSSARWTGPATAEWQAFDGRQKSEYNISFIWVCWGAVLDFLQGVGFLSEQPQSDETQQELPLAEPIHNSPSVSESPEQKLSRWQEMRRDGQITGARQKMAAAWALEQYPPDGNLPEELTVSEMANSIQRWRKLNKKSELADEPLRRACRRILKRYREKPPS